MVKLTKSGCGWVPLFHIPIPGRHNPLIVFPTTHEVVAEVTLAGEGIRVDVSGSVDPSYVRSKATAFLTRLLSEVGMDVSLELRLKASADMPREYTYVHATNTALELLGGKLDEDIVEAAWRIDVKIGLPQSVLALREAQIVSKPYIWRFGEGYVELGKNLTAEVFNRSETVLASNTPPLAEYLTHLAGNCIINIFTGFREGSNLSDLIRLYNALWYAIHGIYPPHAEEGFGVVFPDADKAVSAEVIID